MREPLTYAIAHGAAEAALEAARAEGARICAVVVNRGGTTKVRLDARAVVQVERLLDETIRQADRHVPEVDLGFHPRHVGVMLGNRLGASL